MRRDIRVLIYEVLCDLYDVFRMMEKIDAINNAKNIQP